jgi:hypothetical protein
MSKMTELAQRCHSRSRRRHNRARRGRRSTGDGHRQMACQANRLSPAPFHELSRKRLGLLRAAEAGHTFQETTLSIGRCDISQ